MTDRPRLYKVGDVHKYEDGTQSKIVETHEPFTRGHSYPLAYCENSDVITNGESDYKYTKHKVWPA